MTNTVTHKGFSARIEYDDEDGIFTGRIAGIRDGVGFHADTVAGLREAFHEAVDDYVETCAKIGKPPQRAFFRPSNVPRQTGRAPQGRVGCRTRRQEPEPVG